MITVHSEVGLITNSSTVIYTSANANTVESAKRLVNAILKLSGSTQSADDLYTFTLDFDDDAIEVAIDKLVSDPAKYGIDAPSMSDEELEAEAMKRLNDGWNPSDNYYCQPSQDLIIKDKEGNVVEDFQRFFDSFDKDAQYDG